MVFKSDDLGGQAVRDPLVSLLASYTRSKPVVCDIQKQSAGVDLVHVIRTIESAFQKPSLVPSTGNGDLERSQRSCSFSGSPSPEDGSRTGIRNVVL